MNTSFVVQLIQFIFGLALLIIVHEIGHFVAARLLKVEVEEFGIGLPPRLAKLFTWKGTIFSLNWIPLGGFVRPKGENDPNIPGGLAAANVWTRLAVSFAGPLMNLLVGVILAWAFITVNGLPRTDRVQIIQVVADTPAALAGLQTGDVILQVNDTLIDSQEKLQGVIKANLDQEIRLVYQRDGQVITTTLTPRSKPPEGQGAMGIAMTYPYEKVGLSQAIAGGFKEVYNNVVAILTLPVRALQGQTSSEETRLVGLPGMFRIFQIADTLGFFMMISVSLGVINLFPIPALDGGRILLTLPELIIRRRVPPQWENAIHFAGFVLLLALMIYINIQDIVNPIALPK